MWGNVSQSHGCYGYSYKSALRETGPNQHRSQVSQSSLMTPARNAPWRNCASGLANAERGGLKTGGLKDSSPTKKMRKTIYPCRIILSNDLFMFGLFQVLWVTLLVPASLGTHVFLSLAMLGMIPLKKWWYLRQVSWWNVWTALFG